MESKQLEISNLKRVEKNPSSEVVLAKRHRYTAFKVRSCTVPLDNDIHGSRPLSEVFK